MALEYLPTLYHEFQLVDFSVAVFTSADRPWSKNFGTGLPSDVLTEKFMVWGILCQ